LRARFENDGAPLIIRADECNTEEIFRALAAFRKNAEAGHSRAAFLDYCHALECLIADEERDARELSKKDIIAKIDNLISCYYMYDIKLTDIADCFFVSAHTLNRLIYEYYSDTFHNLLIRRRMQVAASYLLNTEDSVASIAEKAGYSSLNNFYTAFKRHYGVLPADYRRGMKKKDE
jgi:AraC-like DNA-binding protein